MTNSGKILVATDLSAPARHAVCRAFRLGAETGSELSVLHVMELDALDMLREMLGENLLEVKKVLRAEAHARLEELISETGIPRDLVARARISDGSALTAIAAEADALDVQLIVLGARGESFLRHAILGSTAARLLRLSASRPVLVVKQVPHEAYRSIVVAVDFSPASQQTIRLARHWAPAGDLVLLHAFELPYEGKLKIAGVDEEILRQYVTQQSEIRRQHLHEMAINLGLAPAEYSVRVVYGDPAQQIIAMEQEVDADLIVMGKHGSHFAEEFLLGSVIKHVLAQSQCDVMSVGNPQTVNEVLS